MKPVPLILDLDLATDAGDAGMLAMANDFVWQGVIDLLGVCCAGTYNYAPGCADAINAFYGRPRIPIGVNKGPVLEPGPDPEIYNKYITQNFPNRFPNAASAPNAVEVYRQILDEASNGSVVICTGGQLANIAHLFDSPPDSISPLSGAALMSLKVKKLVCMLGDYPTGFEYNIFTDWTSAKNICDNYPGRIEFLGFTPGLNVKTGQEVIDTGNTLNPVYWAYKLFKDANPTFVPRESWDQMALWLAAFGKVRYGITWFRQICGGSNEVHSDGTNSWVSSPVKDQRYTELAGNAQSMASIIDGWQTA